MTKEEDKPQRIPSWVEIPRPPKDPPPTPESRPAVRVDSRRPPSAPREPRLMRQAQQQWREAQDMEVCQQMGMVSAVQTFNMMVQMSAMMAAQHMGSVLPQSEQWCRLNPNFVFSGGLADSNYGIHAERHQPPLGEVGQDLLASRSNIEHIQHPDLAESPAKPQHVQPDLKVPPTASSLAGSVVISNEYLTRQSIEPIQFTKSTCPLRPAAAISKPQRDFSAEEIDDITNRIDFSAEEIDDITNRIFDDLSDEKKRQSYLPPLETTTATFVLHALPDLPIHANLPTLPPAPLPPPAITTQVCSSPISMTKSPPRPLPNRTPPSAPRLMLMRNGRDITKTAWALLKRNSTSPRKATKDTESEYQTAKSLPVSNSKIMSKKDQVEDGMNRDAREQQKLPFRSASSDTSHQKAQDTLEDAQMDINRESNATPARQASPQINDTESSRDDKRSRAAASTDTELSEGNEEGPRRKKRRRVRPSQYTKLSSRELVERHVHQLSSLPAAATTTEQETKEILRRQEDELIKWYEAQQRRALDESRPLGEGGALKKKRKLDNGAEDGGRKKVVRLNGGGEHLGSKVKTEVPDVPVALGDLSAIEAISEGAVVSPIQQSSRQKDDEKLRDFAGADTGVTDPAVAEVNVTLVSGAENISKSVADCPSTVRSEAAKDPRAKTEDETGDEMRIAVPTSETPETPRVPPVPVQAALITEDTGAFEPGSTGPPIPAGEWILDSLLDSLRGPSPGPDAVPSRLTSPKAGAPSKPKKAVMCPFVKHF